MSEFKTKYKYIQFDQSLSLDRNNKKQWAILNNKSMLPLGVVEYYYLWRQYIAVFADNAVFSSGCLLDIADFLKQVNGK